MIISSNYIVYNKLYCARQSLGKGEGRILKPFNVTLQVNNPARQRVAISRK